MTSAEPLNLLAAQEISPQSSRKTYHRPELQEYGTVGDLTRTSPFSLTNSVYFDAAAPKGYLNITS